MPLWVGQEVQKLLRKESVIAIPRSETLVFCSWIVYICQEFSIFMMIARIRIMSDVDGKRKLYPQCKVSAS